MIESLHIENLRGIRSLDVEGLGRVNLIIGRNDVGKTTLLAAAALWRAPQYWFWLAWYLRDARRDPALEVGGYLPECWVPFFHGGDASKPVEVVASGPDGRQGCRVSMPRGIRAWPARFERLPTGQVIDTSREEMADIILDDVAWVSSAPQQEDLLVLDLVELYLRGEIARVLAPLEQVNPEIEKIEVVGESIYLRLRGHPLPLPYGVLGDGARRVLEFALGLSSSAETVHIDELENGFHHSTLPTVIDMLRLAPPTVQVFATTHREELIRVACESFVAADDDGLRIIRLDRDEQGHRAVVYTAKEALAGLDAGLELRG